MKKSFLFPHWCQKVGWWILATLAVFGVIVLILALIGCNVPNWLEGILYSVPFFPSLALFLICLSQEKQEDEYIAHIRTRSVFIIVAIAFVISLIDFPVKLIGARMLSPEQLGTYIMYVRCLTGPITLTFIYLIIFKGSLFMNWLKTRSDDGQ